MKLFILTVVVACLIGISGCRGYRHSISVSVDAPLLTPVTSGQHSTFKVQYDFEEKNASPSQR